MISRTSTIRSLFPPRLELRCTYPRALRLGELRLINDYWGSNDVACSSTTFSAFVDSTIGWTFDRGACGGSGSKPDYPHIEFGIHPFGAFADQGQNDQATTPNFSSTTLLPIQIKDLQSASINVDTLSLTLTSAGSWALGCDIWLSVGDPVSNPDPGLVTQISVFWGWQSGRWPSAPGEEGSGIGETGDKVSSTAQSHTLWVKRDDWGDGSQHYFQFRRDAGPETTFDDSVDLKKFIDYLVNDHSYSTDQWITRFRLFTEIDDNTSGTVTVDEISFEVNGQTRSAVID